MSTGAALSVVIFVGIGEQNDRERTVFGMFGVPEHVPKKERMVLHDNAALCGYTMPRWSMQAEAAHCDKRGSRLLSVRI
jgi:hypothetical protein